MRGTDQERQPFTIKNGILYVHHFVKSLINWPLHVERWSSVEVQL